MSKIDQVTSRVLRLFKRDPTVAVNYSHLVFEYWLEYDRLLYEVNTGTYYIEAKNIGRLQSPESITRAFRKLVEEEKINVPEYVEKLREELEEEYREHYSRKNGERGST